MNNVDKYKKIAPFLDVIQGLSESTGDYLYLWEINAERIWLFGNISEKYHVMNDGKSYCAAQDWENIIYEKDIPAFKADVKKISNQECTVHTMEYRLIDKEGRRVWVSCRGQVKSDEQGAPIVLIGRISDTAMRYKVDELTGMFNIIKFNEDMQKELLYFEKGYLILFGVDNLKSINIRYGREQGDRELKILANVLEEETDFRNTYRLERDCFGVFLADAEQTQVEELYERVKSKVSAYFDISAGAASMQSVSNQDEGTIYQHAEYALDRAKQEGKNTLEFFNEEDYLKEVVSIELREEILDSVKKGCEGFSLVFQPQIKTGSYRLFGAEVLLRYDSIKCGRVMPNDFIPILEKTGLICEVGLWVLKTALEQCRKWREKMPEFHISVNISPVQLMQKDIMEKVLKVLHESSLPGAALTLELTESMQLQDLRYYNEIFCEWRKAGIQIAVDDFGTGYSSLGYLKDLKIDEIKIDRCFVSKIHENSYNYRLLYSVIEWVGGTQIRVCCEGVEEKEELQVLEELNPDLLQGYLFSKPCDYEQFEQMYFEQDSQNYQNYRKLIEGMQKKHIGKLMKLRHGDILKAIDLGLWVICIDQDNDRKEMYADETMLRIMGADSNLSPEECYHFWYERVRPDCLNYVNTSVARCISGQGAVQIQYIWQHPKLGDVEVACAATCTENCNNIAFLEGYHRMVNNIEMSCFSKEACMK